MNEQTKLVRDKKWDILIILDACRYDMFNKYCREYLGEGWLRKIRSPASWTMGWLHRTFDKSDMHDVIYVSSNPYINSRDIGTRFKSKDKFFKVVDVWDGGFDTLFSFLPPLETNKYATVTMDLNRNKKFIIHYMQPHEPYFIYGTYNSIGFNPRVATIRKFLFEFFSDELIWSIMEKLNFRPENYISTLWKEYGKDGIIEGYEENLKLVLENVSNLIKRYPKKKIVITADHGERLGERKRYSHGGRIDKWVREVPWFEVGNEST